ncbi:MULTISPECIES: hypothetical protein [Bacillaceae]|jgi:hypothetical protein|uniref:hypothetical protein n=1 Tax=Bacillaceae TaxID=186817 RepID=UPI000ABFCF73|nr:MULTISPECIES: hypothetical protein [Bacillaceae]
MSKKVSLQEAIKQKLASKQQSNQAGSHVNGPVKKTKELQSQLTKKPNNQRKRTGV